ncbi:MAG: hypothetical protein KJZ87_16590 [Thermoguttaceae bacterium]|nr:hypothetical protein [Thermoguttaceae bacterium]
MDEINPYASPCDPGPLAPPAGSGGESARQYEYKHVRLGYGLGMFSQRLFHQRLMEVLEPLGREGWDLKAILYEGGAHAHLIFNRELRRQP